MAPNEQTHRDALERASRLQQIFEKAGLEDVQVMLESPRPGFWELICAGPVRELERAQKLVSAALNGELNPRPRGPAGRMHWFQP